MMERHTIVEQQEDIQELAIVLLEQAERCALTGLLQYAETNLNHVWTISVEQAPDLANAAAWELAWLSVRRGAYTEASSWFCRIGAPLLRKSQLWPAARQAMVQICRRLANELAEPAVTPQPSHLRSLSAYDLPTFDLPLLDVMNLGRFRIVRAGIELSACPAHKAIALFRYLLTRSHRTAHKEELMELLWPDTHAREATNSLHVAVSMLRRYLDPPTGSYLLFEDDRYTINPHAPVADDYATFQQLSDAGEQCWRADDICGAQRAYARAIACYQGDYYVNPRDLSWAIRVQEQLLSRYLTVLDHLGRIYIAQGHLEQAVECYVRLLERDSYREDAHAQLIRCYLRLDRRADALRQYERCTTVLANDLGLEPMPEIQALYRDIARGTSSC
jgi:DNA-binding SARP family transcriptional activator